MGTPLDEAPGSAGQEMMMHGLPDHFFFNFERDFVESGMRCIPMIVRFKLDACGVKLKLDQWNDLKLHERTELATAPCDTPQEISRYRDQLRLLILQRAGNTVTEIPVEMNPSWAEDDIPVVIKEKCRENGAYDLALHQWRQLSVLQRFALVKLSRPGHENKNLSRALYEFGLI